MNPADANPLVDWIVAALAHPAVLLLAAVAFVVLVAGGTIALASQEHDRD